MTHIEVTPDQRSEIIHILDEAGIDPRVVSVFGVTAQGYHEIQYTPEGTSRIDPNTFETVKAWRQWPNQTVGSAVYQALNPQ